jgi:hypothetical protein
MIDGVKDMVVGDSLQERETGFCHRRLLILNQTLIFCSNPPRSHLKSRKNQEKSQKIRFFDHFW